MSFDRAKSEVDIEVSFPALPYPHSKYTYTRWEIGTQYR